MIKFIRIDHRLLHERMVFSWGKSLQVNRILMANDKAANGESKKVSLELPKLQGIKLNIFTIENTLTKISKIEALSEDIMMIFGSAKDARQFCEGYSDVKEVNYGGIIRKEGPKQFNNAIFLTEDEIEDARVLKSMGIKQFVQQVPTSKKEDLNTII